MTGREQDVLALSLGIGSNGLKLRQRLFNLGIEKERAMSLSQEELNMDITSMGGWRNNVTLYSCFL